MGHCTSKVKRLATQKYIQQYWKQPDDTLKYENIPLQKLQFQGTLANFKIINCQYTAVTVKVEIKSVDVFQLRQKKVKLDKSTNWTFQHKFQFQMTEYQLRKSFVDIMLYDDNQLHIGGTKVNLYLISSGPYHQNFQIKLKKGTNTRIYFDLKISQAIQIQLKSIQAEIDLFTKHPGQKFGYSIKTIVGHNVALNVSQPSYIVKVKLDNKQNIEKNDNNFQLSMSRKVSKNAEKLIPQGHNLVWAKADNLAMPSIVMKTLVSQLHHCYFQIIFWRMLDKSPQSQQENSVLFGECYVALHKIFDTQSTPVQVQGVVKQKREFSSEDKLWYDGQQRGKGLFKFQVISDRYIKQMQVMIRTEQGVMKHIPVYFSNSQRQNNSSICLELTQLIKIQQKIQQTTVKLDKIQTQNNNQYPNFQIRKIKVIIQELLGKLLDLLQKSTQSNMIIYGYTSSQEMMRAQQIFLSLGFKTIGYLQEEDPHINDLCWKILIALIGRSQFILSNVGFDQKQKQKISKNKIQDKLQRKIDIALTYYQFLSKYLKIAVNSLNVKGLQLQRDFASLFCAYAYFRIQNFRNAILQAITRQDDPDLPEWRGIQFSLQQDIDYDQLKQQVNTFTALFDWPNNFHKCLENFQKYQIATSQINQVLNREDWKFRLSKRGITFFQFIKCWVQYVQSIVIKANYIQWKYFPGYSKLLKCFLSQMKKRPILDYPDILKRSLLKLLSNQKLLNAIVAILFHKANIHEPLTVIRAIVLISQIFAQLSEKKKKMHPTFNYNNFYQGIKIIMQSQFSFAISKTIVMLYNHFKIFSLQFRRNISMFLLGKVFFKLFLHWSHNVRHLFYHLLMRLYHESLKINLNQTGSKALQQQVNEEVRTRFLKLMVLLDETWLIKKQKSKTYYFKNKQKQLYKRLKRNIQAKKKKLKKLQITQNQGTFFNCPDSPASQKIMDMQIMFQQKFVLYGSTVKQRQRSNSQILRPTLKLTNRISNIQKQQQIKTSNKKIVGDFKHRIYDTTNGQKILLKFSINDQYGQYNQSDFQIPKIQNQLLEYIEDAMIHFKSINDQFTKNINNKFWELPKIQMEMPLDSKEIRPEKIDKW